MSQKYNTPHVAGSTHFSRAPVASPEFSRMLANPNHSTSFNAGDIVPLYYAEILPHDTFKLSTDFISRLQSAVIKPTMGKMQLDIYAFFVPNRIINESWVNVMGENTSGYWTAPEVDLAPLYPLDEHTAVSVPIGSVADYYGFPTQAAIPAVVLQQCNDLKFRGYLEIFNRYFRDENYQPPIPYSKLNVYNGFFEPVDTLINMRTRTGSTPTTVPASTPPDGSFPDGALIKSIYGEGATRLQANPVIPARTTKWSALSRPLKANKLHDAFTSALSSPQKGSEVFFGIGSTAPVSTHSSSMYDFSSPLVLKFSEALNGTNATNKFNLVVGAAQGANTGIVAANSSQQSGENVGSVYGSNLVADLSQATGVSVNELRTAIAVQQIYEQLARGGSRYISVIKSFFGLSVDNPFSDIPIELGHIRRDMDMYQVAQTSASQEGNTAQGDLAAFGYTTSGGEIFTPYTAKEYGYIHVVGIVRHRNVYSTFLAPDNFRKTTLDFYNPFLANLGEQPIRLATLNPFAEDAMEKVLGYQEAWWEYRHEPDRVSGMLRTGINNGLDIWTYADPFDRGFDHINGEWLKSNSQEVLDRTLAVTSDVADQFIGLFAFAVDKQRPMPTYSVPGLDTI